MLKGWIFAEVLSLQPIAITVEPASTGIITELSIFITMKYRKTGGNV